MKNYWMNVWVNNVPEVYWMLSSRLPFCLMRVCTKSAVCLLRTPCDSLRFEIWTRVETRRSSTGDRHRPPRKLTRPTKKPCCFMAPPLFDGDKENIFWGTNSGTFTREIGWNSYYFLCTERVQLLFDYEYTCNEWLVLEAQQENVRPVLYVFMDCVSARKEKQKGLFSACTVHCTCTCTTQLLWSLFFMFGLQSTDRVYCTCTWKCSFGCVDRW